MSNLALHEITSVGRTAVAERLLGDVAPRDRVTVTPEALASDDTPGDPPRSDVRWYRPRGAGVLAFRGGRPTRTDPLDARAEPRVHGAVRAYRRMIALAAYG